MNPTNRKHIGDAYGAVTLALAVTLTASWWCWESQNVGNHPTETLHDVCLAIWVVSGALLALSQIVFVGAALRTKDGAIAKTELTPGAPAGAAPASDTKVLILTCGTVILLAIAFFLFLLSSMPS